MHFKTKIYFDMKKRIFTTIVALIAVMIGTNVQAQKQAKPTSCQVKFSLKYEGEYDPQTKAQMPTEQIYTIFGNKTKYNMNLGISVVVITDGDATKMVQLFDYPGMPFAIVREKDQVEELFAGTSFKYEKNGQTKNICGYECTGYSYSVYSEDSEDPVATGVVYTTTAIGTSSAINFMTYPNLEGYPLYTEQTSTKSGNKTIREAVEIKKAKANAGAFLIPENYKILSDEEIESLFGGSDDEDEF